MQNLVETAYINQVTTVPVHQVGELPISCKSTHPRYMDTMHKFANPIIFHCIRFLLLNWIMPVKKGLWWSKFLEISNPIKHVANVTWSVATDLFEALFQQNDFSCIFKVNDCEDICMLHGINVKRMKICIVNKWNRKKERI